MPPAGQPCGRTDAPAKRSSCASDATNTSSSPSSPCAAPTTSSPALSADDLELGLAAGRRRWRRASRRPASCRARSAGRRRATRAPAPARRVVGERRGSRRSARRRRAAPSVGGTDGQVDGREPDEPPEARDGADLGAARGVDASTGWRRACCDARAALIVGGPSGPSGRSTRAIAAGGAEEHAARDIRDLEHGGRALRAPAPRDARPRVGQQRAPRRAEALGDLGELVGRRAPRCGAGSPSSSSSSAISARSLSRSASSSMRRELREPPQPQLEDVLGLHLAQVEDVHAGACAPARRRRSCG